MRGEQREGNIYDHDDQFEGVKGSSQKSSLENYGINKMKGKNIQKRTLIYEETCPCVRREEKEKN